MSASTPLSLLTLAAVLLALGALLSGAVVWVMARALLRPPRMTDGKAAWVLKRLSPGDLGLHYEDVAFHVRDVRSGGKLRINGWWIPAGGARDTRSQAHGSTSGLCVVLLHGYADAKVGAVAWAPLWHELGFNVLAIDLRAHGESGGVESTAGYFERHDVAQVIAQLRAERPAETERIALFGASLGAAVAAAVAAPGDDDAGIAAVILESPFADFRAAATTHMDALGLPGGAFQRAALWLAERMSGARFNDVRTLDLLRTIRCPMLVIAPAADLFLSTADVAAMEAALHGRPEGSGLGRVWQVGNAGHLTAAFVDRDEYRRNLKGFLAGALEGSQLPHLPPTSPQLARGTG